MAYSDLIRNKSKALRLALDDGELNLKSLRSFLLLIEEGDREKTPSEIMYDKNLSMLNQKTKVKLRKHQI